MPHLKRVKPVIGRVELYNLKGFLSGGVLILIPDKNNQGHKMRMSVPATTTRATTAFCGGVSVSVTGT